MEITSRGGNAINGSINVAIKADKFAPSIKNDVTGDVTLENIKTGGSLSFGDGESINIGGMFTANTKGDFDYGATILAGKDISITAQNNVGTAANPILVGNTANKSAKLEIYGKGIYLKGVNAGMLTLGDVIGTTFSASSEGAIAQANGKFIKLDKIEVTATNNITLDNVGNSIKAATLR